MRILLATDWNRGRGGAEAYASLLREALEAAGDEVRLLTSSVGTAGDGGADYVARGSERRAAQAFLQIANPFAVACARRALRAFRPDVVWVNMFAHHLSPALLHALGDVPFVLSVSDYKCICPLGSKLLPDGSLCARRAGLVCSTSGCVGALHWLRDRPRYALLHAGVRRAARVVACSAWVRDALADDGIPAEVMLLPVRAPEPGYERAPAATPTLLYVGRLDREKGLPLLLRAFADVRLAEPASRLRIAGVGPERTLLDRLVAELALGDAVTFTGWCSPAGIEQELASAWALVAPSLWAEPLGLVAPEAIVRGVPVIASARGGFAETVVDGASGLLFENGDRAALAKHLLRIVRREVFPEHAVPPPLVAAAIARHEPHRHAAQLRTLFLAVQAERARLR